MTTSEHDAQLKQIAKTAIEDAAGDLDRAVSSFLDKLDIGPLGRLLLGPIVEHRARDFLRDVARAEAAGQRQSHGGTHSLPARPAVPNSPVVSTSVLLASRTETARSVLDTLMVNGRPIRQVTAAEAMEWAEKRHGEAKLARALATGVPPTGLIGDYVNDEEAAARAKLAEASNA